MQAADQPKAAPPKKAPPPAPFIVAAQLPADLLAWADGLRRAHYPPERNKLVAHVTLFHSFAPSLREELLRTLGDYAARFAPPPARLEGLIDFGQGTALRIHSPAMSAIRAHIAEHFHGSLTTQDLQEPRLHITVQNKVTPQAARALQAELAASVQPREFSFRGLELHLYRETHWDRIGSWSFRGKEAP